MRPLRRPIAAVAAAAATVMLSGCSDTNFGAQTNQQYQAAVGANVTGDVDVLNTLLVANSDGTATLSAGLVNHEEADDTVTGVSAQSLSGSNLPVTAAEEDVTLPFDRLVPLGRAGEPGIYTVSSAPLGQYVRLVVSFENAPDSTIEAPVVDRTEMYSEVASG
ncbi:hypothetical protein [Aeromicrobium sp. CF3.5]|uniref:hypothetical protein n=1 Tax=Aeromicrobium sp. CF3.5 TaxID=3373078 RepID=UPI003EE43CEB